MVTTDHVKFSLEKLCGMHAGAYPEFFFKEQEEGGGGGFRTSDLKFQQAQKGGGVSYRV